MKSIIDWWNSLWREEYQLKIYFPGEIATLADGSTVEKPAAEKQFVAKKLIKTTPKHFIWIDLKDRRHEIKFLKPVVFHIIKIY